MKISLIAFYLQVCSVFCHVTCEQYYCSTMFGKWQHLKSIRQCCGLSVEQMNLIAWFFVRVSSYIEVTEVVPEEISAQRSKFTSYFLKDLFQHTGLEYFTYRVDYSHRDQLKDEDEPYAQTYKWHAELLKGVNRTHFVEDTESTFEKMAPGNGVREDDPDFGSVVLSEHIETLDAYLNGETRHPFKAKRAHYVLIVYRAMESRTWDKWASSVLSKLWTHHGILNAIIISTCKEKNFGYYDPFVNVKSWNVGDVDEWGIFRCIPIKSLNFNDSWLVEKEYKMNKFPLTFTIFERYPTMFRNIPPIFAKTHYNRGMKATGFGGIDALLLGNLADAINFTVRVIETSDDYGFKLKNGTFTATIADVLYGHADVAFNGRFLQKYGSPDIEFLLPILGDKVCVIAPAAEKIPQWKAIFRCFDAYCWFSFALITLLSSVCFLLLKMWQDKQQMDIIRESLFYKDFKHLVVEEKCKFHGVFLATWKVMMGMTVSMPYCSVERLLIGSCLLANLIISGTFESSLYTAYTKRTYYKNIDTLSDLDLSDLLISASSPSLRNLFGNNQTPSDVLKSLKGKFYLDDGIESTMERTAYKRDLCSVERFSDVEIIIKTKYLNPDGSPQLHVVKECPRHLFLTYIVRRGWPLLPHFNRMINRFAEAGLVSLWYQATEEAFIMNKSIENTRFNREQYVTRKPFSIKDIQTSIYFLIIGHLMATIVFLIEKFVMPPKRFNGMKRSKRIIEKRLSKKQRMRKILFK